MANRLDTTSTVTLVLNGQQSETSLRDVNRAVNSLRTSLTNMRREDDPALYRQRVQELHRLRDAQREMSQEINNSAEEQKGFFAEFRRGFGEIGRISAGATIGTLLAGGLQTAAGALKSFATSVIQTYSTFEKFDAVLTNALGSSSQSSAALKMLSKFAAETPFSMEELTGSFIKLVNRGIKPTTSELRSMGDLASSQGKSFDELTEAVLDAMTGEFERLKEFGIRASKNGDVVKLSFKGVTQEVANTEEAIKKAVLGFGNMDGVAGGMQKMSERIGGVISNIGDNWDRFLNKMGQNTGGMIFGVAKMLNSVVEWLGETRTAAEKLTESYYQQKNTVAELEKNTSPLINRYEELTSKGKLNKAEQDELNTIIKTLSQTIPTAVTQWDKYGNAIGINTDKAREFIKMQRAMMQIQNKDAIDKTEAEIKDMEGRQGRVQALLAAGKVQTMQGAGAGDGALRQSTRKLTADEILKASKELSEIETKIEAAKLGIRGLKGENIAIPETETKTTESKPEKTEAQLKKEAAAREKAKKERQAYADGMRDLNARLKEFNEDELADLLAKYDKAAQALEKKFAKEQEAEQKALDKLKNSKYKNDDEIAAKQKQIDDLSTRKTAAVNALRIRQEEEVGEVMLRFRDKMAGKRANELQKEQEQINEHYDKLKEDAGSNNALVDKIEADRAVALADAKIREEERFQDERERLTAEGAVSAADKDAVELARIKKKYDDEIAALREKFGLEKMATEEGLAMIELVNKNRKAEQDKVGKKDEGDQKKQIREAALESAQNISNAVFEIGRNNRQAETDDKLNQLDKEREAELSNKNLTEAQKQSINDKYDAEAKAIKLQAWEADKEAALQSAVINGALAVIKALPNPIAAIAAGVAAAAQIAVIASSKAPKFGKGGKIMGPSHDEGGIPLINGNTGEQVAEVEGDETLAVFSKATSRNNKMLINELLYNGQYRNGAPVRVNSELAIKATPQYLATGGMVNSTGAGTKYTSDSTAPTVAGDMAETNALLANINANFAAWSQKPWAFPMLQFMEEVAKYEAINKKANPK